MYLLLFSIFTVIYLLCSVVQDRHQQQTATKNEQTLRSETAESLRAAASSEFEHNGLDTGTAVTVNTLRR